MPSQRKKNQQDSVTTSNRKQSLTEGELKKLAKCVVALPQFWWRIICAVAIATGISVVAGWALIRNAKNDINAVVNTKMEEVRDAAEKDIAKRSESANKEIEREVAKWFEEPRIVEHLQKVAAERASVLLTNQIMPEVVRFKGDVAGQLLEISNVVAASQAQEREIKNKGEEIQGIMLALQKSLGEMKVQLATNATMQKNLEEIAAFQLLAVKAIGDDAVAWDTLCERGMKAADRFQKEARSLSLAIQHPFCGPLPVASFTVMQPEAASIAQTCSVVVAQTLVMHLDSPSHTHLTESIWQRSDLSNFDKFSILAHIMDKTTSLSARAAAGKHIAAEKKDYFNILRKEKWLDWWQQNKERIRAESEKKN
ncbi:MAG: hypothetical protein ACOYOU_15835 [Kiritimatiellia bacterium]